MISTLPTDIALKIEKVESCWIWRGYLNSCGYGRVQRNGRVTLAHRLIYELLVAKIGGGLELHHTCENRACVNPTHLIPTTYSDHQYGYHHRGRKDERTHCVNGHIYSLKSKYVDPRGNFHCRVCHRKWDCERREKRRKLLQ